MFCKSGRLGEGALILLSLPERFINRWFLPRCEALASFPIKNMAPNI